MSKNQTKNMFETMTQKTTKRRGEKLNNIQ